MMLLGTRTSCHHHSMALQDQKALNLGQSDSALPGPQSSGAIWAQLGLCSKAKMIWQ